MVYKGTIQPIDVEMALEPSLRTSERLGRGATPGQVRSIYGARARHDRDDDAGADDLIVDDANHRCGRRFTFEDGRLAWLIAGRYPALSFSEGCL